MKNYIQFDQIEGLRARKLITTRLRGDHWLTIKYHRRVMFDDLWSQHPEILEARGHTYDTRTGRLVVVPPEKTFDWNHGGEPSDPAWYQEPVTAYRKFNGSMLALTDVDGELLVSTTGSTGGEFVDRGRKILADSGRLVSPGSGVTRIYEIVCDEDPHIVDDPRGAHHLGDRIHSTGQWVPAANEHTITGLTRGQAIELAQSSTGEGYMVIDHNGLVVKVKSEVYRGKKRLMRMSAGDLDRFWNTHRITDFRLPGSWARLTDLLKSQVSLSTFKEMNEWQRRLTLETLLREASLGSPVTSTGGTKTS